MMTLLMALALAAPRDDVAAALTHLSPANATALLEQADARALALVSELDAYGAAEGVQQGYYRALADNLAGKQSMGLSFDAHTLEQTAIAFEAVRVRTFVTAGVWPKRYFGYVDEVGDTAVAEVRVRRAVQGAVEVINAHQQTAGSPLRVNDAEVVVTFIAEGGALWLGTESHRMDALHPVFDVGLDDLAKGLQDEPELMASLDARLGTHLSSLVAWAERDAEFLPVPTVVSQHQRWLQSRDTGARPYLTRLMTLEEAVAGTALMWIWEKEIADRLMTADGYPPLHTFDADDQFIIGSLVYNSGLLHNRTRWRMIRDFTTGEWVFAASERNAQRRWRLNVLAPQDAVPWLVSGRPLPDQPTAWLAGYHVLQRYGAWHTLHTLSDVFDSNHSMRADPNPLGQSPR